MKNTSWISKIICWLLDTISFIVKKIKFAKSEVMQTYKMYLYIKHNVIFSLSLSLNL